jgi:hypothetical protein
MSGISLLIIYCTAKAAGNADRAMEKLATAPPADYTYTAHLVEQLSKQGKVQTLEVKREGHVEVFDMSNNSYRIKIGPATVIIIKTEDK